MLPRIVFRVEYGDFCHTMEEHRLRGGVLYHVNDVPDVDTANRCMDRVREYRL